jgi:hypothetical protein
MLKAAAEAIVGTRAIVQKGSLNVKNEARKNVAQSAPIHNAHAPVRHHLRHRDRRQGPRHPRRDRLRQDKPGGALGNLLEYGSRNNAPHRDLGRAFDSELPRFEDAIALMAKNLL